MSDQIELICPAGYRIEGAVQARGGCLCRIEQQMVPITEMSFRRCASPAYVGCLTWINHDQTRWRGFQHWVRGARIAAIEKQHGVDEAADAVLAGEAPISAMFD